MSLTIVVLICFIAITLGTITLGMLYRDLVMAGGANKTPSILERSRMLRSMNKRADIPAGTSLEKLDRWFDQLILESGVPFSSLSAGLLCVTTGLGLGGAVWLFLNRPEVGLMTAALSMTLPLIWFMFKRRKRMLEIREEIPQLLDLLARSTRAGRSLEQSLTLANEEMKGHLSNELGLCIQQLEVGKSFSAVMKSLAGRIQLLEVRILASTLTVQRLAGGNLPETLDRMAKVVRDRLYANKKIRAATAAGKTSALLIATICPIAYATMFVLQPDHMKVLLDDPLGQSLLLTAAGLELLGMFWVASLLKQEE
ncbi:MAG: type II secretion system F family protein [Planctomycetaceae bacterium]|nr:type II secretion system F family protein [Planctomycetaceae bacterium]